MKLDHDPIDELGDIKILKAFIDIRKQIRKSNFHWLDFLFDFGD